MTALSSPFSFEHILLTCLSNFKSLSIFVDTVKNVVHTFLMMTFEKTQKYYFQNKMKYIEGSLMK